MRRAYTISCFVFALAIAFVGCGPAVKAKPEVVEKIRVEVAKILKKDQIDIRKPLGAQGADELDIVEIVMAVGEAFKVEIPDNAIGEKPDKIAKTLTIEKLAEIVTEQLEKRKR